MVCECEFLTRGGLCVAVDAQMALDEAHDTQEWLEQLLKIAKATGAAAAIKAAEAKREADALKAQQAESDETALRVGHHNKKQKIHYVINLRKEVKRLKAVRDRALVPPCRAFP